MKSSKELNNLYETRLKPTLQTLEEQRKSVLYKYLTFSLGIVLSIGASLLLIDYFPPIVFIAIVLILVFLFLIYNVSKEQKVYRSLFKQNVVREIVYLINPEWNYNSEGKISSMNYQSSGLFEQSWDRYKGDDMVTGEIEKVDFQFSELHTEYKTVTTHDGKRQEEWHTIFKGLFAHADFNKEINGRTLVLPDTAEKLFGKWGQNLQKDSSKGKLIKMENPEFEKLFVVYGSDQIESRYILTPTMMEAMVNIRKKYNKNMYFSFIGSRVYIAMSFSQDLFEPRLFRSGVRFEDMENMNQQFSLIEIIIHEMNLNSRIWTKD